MSIFASVGSAWKNAKTAPDNSYTTLPDGDYIFRIDSAIGDADRNGTPIVIWELATKLPNEEQVQTRKYSYCNEQGLPFLKRDFKALDVDPDQVNTLYMEQWLLYFEGAYVHGRVTNAQKGDKKYNNIYFDKLYAEIKKEPPRQIAEDVGFAPVEDDLPF